MDLFALILSHAAALCFGAATALLYLHRSARRRTTLKLRLNAAYGKMPTFDGAGSAAADMLREIQSRPIPVVSPYVKGSNSEPRCKRCRKRLAFGFCTVCD
jgi:hypothetical protein